MKPTVTLFTSDKRERNVTWNDFDPPTIWRGVYVTGSVIQGKEDAEPSNNHSKDKRKETKTPVSKQETHNQKHKA
jgi:hypothetical protein